METRLGLAPIALSPAPLVIKMLSSNLKTLKKIEFVYSNVLSILNLSGFTVCVLACRFQFL